MTAIIVNWNGERHLQDCLVSLGRQAYEPLEVIVVDNGSTDGSKDIVRRAGVRWLPLPTNVGFAPALNAGAAVAASELLLFLNNDMRFAPDFVGNMVACLERNPRCVAVDAVQRDWDDKHVVHAATRLARGTWRDRLPGWRFERVDAANDMFTVWASGANTLIKRDAFNALGGWDSRFIAGYEDVDLGWRIWLSGKEIRMAADAICWHKVGASSSTSEGAAIRKAAAAHGPLLFALKHAPVVTAILAMVRIIASTVAAVAKGDIARARVMGRTVCDSTFAVPQVIRHRVSEYRARASSPAQHWRKMLAIVEG